MTESYRPEPTRLERRGKRLISMGENMTYNPNIKSERIVYSSQKRPTHNTNIITDKNHTGWFDHLGDRPVYIESKKHLAEVCDQRGLYARSIMKPKSQGKGFENRWRRT